MMEPSIAATVSPPAPGLSAPDAASPPIRVTRQFHSSTSSGEISTTSSRGTRRSRPLSNNSSTQSGDTRRSSIFGRLPSSLGGNVPLRDTIFGKNRADPLEVSTREEFKLTIIDERGAMEQPIADLIRPRVACGSWSVAAQAVFAIGFLMVVSTFIATMVFTELDGYDLDPGLVFGAFQTFILCMIVFVTYVGVQSFQAHPNPIIFYKCCVDILLSMRFLLDPILKNMGIYIPGDQESCAFLSGVTQFLYLASDSWYFALIIDLYQSFVNPFTSVKHDRVKYFIAVFCFSAFSGVIMSSIESFHGFADGNYCWTRRGESKKRDLWKPNIPSWLLFYDWMIVYYIAGIAVLVFGIKRLRSGLKVTLETRRDMLRNGAVSIMSFTAYWTFAFTWYAVSFSRRKYYEDGGRMTPSKVFRTYTYTLAGRGAVDFFVWFMINSPSLIRDNWLKFTPESADKKFSAQLNTALQRELIFYTIECMTKAVQLADEDHVRQRERSPTQEMVLGTGSDTSQDFVRPSDSAPVIKSDHTLSMIERRTDGNVSVVTISDTDENEAASRRSSHRQSFLSNLGFSHRTAVDSPTSSATSKQDIKFTPYKSEAFAELRSACGIKTEDFLKSFEASTKPSISEGASGAFMFFSGDKKYIVKSMAEAECRFLCEIADQYVDYLITSPWSLITKFYGCFRITLYEKKFYFVVMENLFAAMEDGVQIHHRYDIKGSWVNRSYKRPRRGAKVKCRHCSMQFKYGAKKALLQCPNVVGLHEPNVVLKDNDLRTRMRIGGRAGKELFEYLREDSLFLCSLGIMDYSLLLGATDIEFMVDQTNSRRNTVTSPSNASHSGHDLSNGGRGDRSLSDDESVNSSNRATALFSVRSAAHGSNADVNGIVEPPPTRSVRKSERVFGPGFYHIGIIDILQQWNTQKKLERFWKVRFQQCDPQGLSAIDPVRYQKRFEAKMLEIIAIPKEFQRELRAGLSTRFQSQRSTGFIMRPSIPEEALPSTNRSRQDDPALVSSASTSTEDDDTQLDMEQSSKNPVPILMDRRYLPTTSSVELTRSLSSLV
ncbi:hypothetical protein Poli38472_013272 [Pythium oligandrum]|uniref:PIPK domain-containing protein n=1 Tax=Pythium oligandrum TaxID=41045 RepID=A0A8K1FAT1_PYTOL|nr:hypothetical protein Poli38472_013272 [Pythium oligandrum]|eukprot:TMW55381.1 hypothetical protein Poli38472_013272 [Pythium oligandrum]